MVKYLHISEHAHQPMLLSSIAQGIPNLPENLKDAVKEMTRDPLIYQMLGDHTYNKYLEAKRLEWEQYRSYVSDWEISHYLDR